MTADIDGIPALLKALKFAAQKHRDQRRKDSDASPYINHPIEVAEALASVGGITDLTTLQAAILHDTIEDTRTSPEELEVLFGLEVRRLVEEMTDDKRLPKAERKRLQTERAPHLSHRAKQIKIADKISNVRDVTHAPPKDWPLERRREYLDWTEGVVVGCRGCNPMLERLYDEVLQEGRRYLACPSEPSPGGDPEHAVSLETPSRRNQEKCR
jgi:(p)ppGpp synthase/HD superfamily hydrolase